MFAGFRTRDGKKKTSGTNQSAIEMTERPSTVKTEKSFGKAVTKRLWCNGNKSPCHGEVPGSIPGRRSTDTNSKSLVVGSSPVSVTKVESPS